MIGATGLKGEDFITTQEWSLDELETLFALAAELKAARAAGRPTPLLDGQDALHDLLRRLDAHPQLVRDRHDPARRPRHLPVAGRDADQPRRKRPRHRQRAVALRRRDRHPALRLRRGQRLPARGGRACFDPGTQHAVRRLPPLPDPRRLPDHPRDSSGRHAGPQARRGVDLARPTTCGRSRCRRASS